MLWIKLLPRNFESPPPPPPPILSSYERGTTPVLYSIFFAKFDIFWVPIILREPCSVWVSLDWWNLRSRYTAPVHCVYMGRFPFPKVFECKRWAATGTKRRHQCIALPSVTFHLDGRWLRDAVDPVLVGSEEDDVDLIKEEKGEDKESCW